MACGSVPARLLAMATDEDPGMPRSLDGPAHASVCKLAPRRTGSTSAVFKVRIGDVVDPGTTPKRQIVHTALASISGARCAYWKLRIGLRNRATTPAVQHCLISVFDIGQQLQPRVEVEVVTVLLSPQQLAFSNPQTRPHIYYTSTRILAITIRAIPTSTLNIGLSLPEP